MSYFLTKIVNRIRMELLSLYFNVLKSGKTFSYQGKRLHYFYHIFNETWSTERAVEIPIFLDLVKDYHGKKILEVGNVLNNYAPFDHDVLDKYEKSPGVINEDVTTFKSKTKYDLIISVSTMEHVGWDEAKKDPNKIILGIENLQSNLAEGGQILISFPPGYNSSLDRSLTENRLSAERIVSLDRVSYEDWILSDFSKVIKKKYNNPFPRGNGLFMMYFSKPHRRIND